MVRSALYVTTASRPANYGLRGIFYLPDVFRRTDAGRVGDQRSAVNRWYHDSRLPRVRFRVAAPHPCTTTIMVPACMVNLDRRHIRPKRNRTQSSASYTRPALPLGADYYLTSLTSVMHRRTEKTRTGQPARAVAKGERRGTTPPARRPPRGLREQGHLGETRRITDDGYEVLRIESVITTFCSFSLLDT